MVSEWVEDDKKVLLFIEYDIDMNYFNIRLTILLT